MGTGLSIDESITASPMAVDALAASVGMRPEHRRFRRMLWQAIEEFRDRTGVQLRQVDGVIAAVSPAEQIEASRRRFETAAVRRRRGAEIAMAAAGRDASLTNAAIRVIERGTREPILANAQRADQTDRIRALTQGKKT